MNKPFCDICDQEIPRTYRHPTMQVKHDSVWCSHAKTGTSSYPQKGQAMLTLTPLFTFEDTQEKYEGGTPRNPHVCAHCAEKMLAELLEKYKA